MADGVEQVESSSSLAPRLISLLVLFANARNVNHRVNDKFADRWRYLHGDDVAPVQVEMKRRRR